MTHSNRLLPLHPALNRLTNAWAQACATRPDVAALAATAPQMHATLPAAGEYVLQGLTRTGGAICACLTPDQALRIIAVGGDSTISLHILLADLARETIAA